MNILAVNAGSSSLKLRLIGPDDEQLASSDDTSIEAFVASAGPIDAVGHRVVHGGTRWTSAVTIDDEVRAGLDALTALAPLHQPAALRGIDAVGRLLPGVPQVACFDTAFHTTIPAAAAIYALPREWNERWQLRRYGFHGLSHAWASARAAALAQRSLQDIRAVTCHLGAGASCCAIVAGRSVDTTMGFTPLEGLVMATRAGTVDPGLILWLVANSGLSLHEISDALEHRAGLTGLAGDGDMRVVLAAVGDDPAAELAVAVWTHRLRREIGAMAAATGGVDLLVFTGGVGEFQPGLRSAVCARLDWLGVALDEAANQASTTDAVISRPDSQVTVAVVTAREDLQIAAETRAVLAGSPAAS